MNAQQKRKLRNHYRWRKKAIRCGRYTVGKTRWDTQRNIVSMPCLEDAKAFLDCYIEVRLPTLWPQVIRRPYCLWIRDKKTGEIIYTQTCEVEYSHLGSRRAFQTIEKVDWKVEGF